MGVVGFEHPVERPAVVEHLVRLLAAPFTAPRRARPGRDVQADDHRAARRDGGEVLLQPAELPLVEIPHIEVAAADVEAVVEHHVVHAAAVESVVGRAEVLLERAFRPVARPHAEVHVVVARDVEERDPARGEGLADRFEKRGPAVDVADYIAADHTQRRHSVGGRQPHVVRGPAHAVQLALEVDLRIGDRQQAVARHVLRRGLQREVVAPSAGCDASVDAGRAVAQGDFVPVGQRQVDELRLRVRRQAVAPFGVGAHDRAAVRDANSRHAPAGSRHAAAQIDRARGRPPRDGKRRGGEQRRKEDERAGFHFTGSRTAAHPPPGAILKATVSSRVTSRVSVR